MITVVAKITDFKFVEANIQCKLDYREDINTNKFDINYLLADMTGIEFTATSKELNVNLTDETLANKPSREAVLTYIESQLPKELKHIVDYMLISDIYATYSFYIQSDSMRTDAVLLQEIAEQRGGEAVKDATYTTNISFNKKENIISAQSTSAKQAANDIMYKIQNTSLTGTNIEKKIEVDRRLLPSKYRTPSKNKGRYDDTFSSTEINLRNYEDYLSELKKTLNISEANYGSKGKFRPKKYAIEDIDSISFTHKITNDYNDPKNILKKVMDKTALAAFLIFRAQRLRLRLEHTRADLFLEYLRDEHKNADISNLLTPQGKQELKTYLQENGKDGDIITYKTLMSYRKQIDNKKRNLYEVLDIKKRDEVLEGTKYKDLIKKINKVISTKNTSNVIKDELKNFDQAQTEQITPAILRELDKQFSDWRDLVSLKKSLELQQPLRDTILNGLKERIKEIPANELTGKENPTQEEIKEKQDALISSMTNVVEEYKISNPHTQNDIMDAIQATYGTDSELLTDFRDTILGKDYPYFVTKDPSTLELTDATKQLFADYETKIADTRARIDKFENEKKEPTTDKEYKQLLKEFGVDSVKTLEKQLQNLEDAINDAWEDKPQQDTQIKSEPHYKNIKQALNNLWTRYSELVEEQKTAKKDNDTYKLFISKRTKFNSDVKQFSDALEQKLSTQPASFGLSALKEEKDDLVEKTKSVLGLDVIKWRFKKEIDELNNQANNLITNLDDAEYIEDATERKKVITELTTKADTLYNTIITKYKDLTDEERESYGSSYKSLLNLLVGYTSAKADYNDPSEHTDIQQEQSETPSDADKYEGINEETGNNSGVGFEELHKADNDK